MLWFVEKKRRWSPLHLGVSAAHNLPAEPLHLYESLTGEEKKALTNQATPRKPDCCVCALSFYLITAAVKLPRQITERRQLPRESREQEKHQLTCQRRHGKCSSPKHSEIPCGNKEGETLKPSLGFLRIGDISHCEQAQESFKTQHIR